MAEAVTTTENAATTAPSSETTTSTAPDWYESLAPEYKVDPHIMPFKGKPISEVLRSHIEAQKFVSSSIRLPKPDAKPEEREAFLADLSTKLGRPATAADYKKAITLEAVPDGTPWDEGVLDDVLTEMHKAHATPAQVGAAVNAYRRALAKGMAAQTQMMQETERMLKQEWGGQYDRKLALAQHAGGTVGGADFIKLLESKGIANHPLVIRTLAAFGETLSEAKIISGDLPGLPGQTDAESRLTAIYNDKAHPYHKGDPKAVEEVLNLTRIALGPQGSRVMATMG